MAQALLLQLLVSSTAAGAIAAYASSEVFGGKPIGSPEAVGLTLVPAFAAELAEVIAPAAAFDALLAGAAS